jgi:hypothetical protein
MKFIKFQTPGILKNQGDHLIINSLLSYEKQNREETENLLSELNQKISILNHFKYTSVNPHLHKSLGVVGLFEQLKFKYVERVELINKLSLLKSGDRITMIKDVNRIFNTLKRSNEVIPNYNLNLTGLPKIDEN